VIPVNRFALSTPLTSHAADVTNGNYVLNDGATNLWFNNTTGSTQTITITLTAGSDVNLTTGPRTYTIATGTAGVTGFFPVGIYGSQLLINCTGAVFILAESFAG
jgi:hypothetical protein